MSGLRMRLIHGMPAALRMPHIGEYATKTNAIHAWKSARHARKRAVAGYRSTIFRLFLLPVVFQNLIASLGQLVPDLLQAAENDEVACVLSQLLTAVFVHVMGA